MSFTENYKWME